ncbi:putative oxidoreductase C663.08c [Colletotrichum chlorophyti]|uniref:Putative oxidoreductase C663.08c n=1 Tax=Colletotrichum chlorophyti TaxID=708187 RepID=A0A1Q8RBY6_9PEZI|nr:putative oxidoreductase C663.08c [Colletotrichum chlorophyti]
MPSYLVTGVNRGIGWEFLRQISNDSNNTIVGTVRNKAAVEKKIADELGNRPNLHIVEVELANYESIKDSVQQVSRITRGKLDYIIANAALISDWSAYDSIGKLGETPQELEDDLLNCFKVNVVGNVHLFNLYIPLILKGDAKKVIAITSGLADLEVLIKYRLDHGAPYSISKAAMNIAIGKFHAQYADEGVLFLAIAPGLIDTGHNDNVNEHQLQCLMKIGAKFNEYTPGFQPLTAEDSVAAVLKVVYGSSLENGNGGDFLSQFGNKQWL